MVPVPARSPKRYLEAYPKPCALSILKKRDTMPLVRKKVVSGKFLKALEARETYETGNSPNVPRRRHDHVCLRRKLRDGLDPEDDRDRNLREVPPVLHGQTEVRRHDRTRGAIQAAFGTRQGKTGCRRCRKKGPREKGRQVRNGRGAVGIGFGIERARPSGSAFSFPFLSPFIYHDRIGRIPLSHILWMNSYEISKNRRRR